MGLDVSTFWAALAGVLPASGPFPDEGDSAPSADLTAAVEFTLVAEMGAGEGIAGLGEDVGAASTASAAGAAGTVGVAGVTVGMARVMLAVAAVPIPVSD